MRRGLLLIDRGSREEEVKEELQYICEKVKLRGNYYFSDYCFLEVVPPYIADGIKKCLSQNIDALTIIPYFLYPGRKVKAAVNTAVRLQSQTGVKFTISRPMTLHKSLIKIVDEKIDSVLKKNKISIPKIEVDILLIGHGSKDPNARMSLRYVADGLEERYRSVKYCFLEIEEPNIKQGIEMSAQDNPNILVVMPYFLHKGVHVKRDIHEDLDSAITNSGINNILVSEHLGTDDGMIDLVLQRAREVEI
ncbi:MAG: sirohydrochlorin cobaltochelatase [Thaumarchaeota archaeon 13_1_40CM_38_12]|nr:MAG: sirohydrochlorin cobaltochelatase [Thaumarchaeota archaeon 13_1_40CM_38_12]OLC35773.1 MAG: sirohydrochlorin cobaltochelatase [Thaumarchaeota archaeon 13_1_40CM_4_38_7]OLC93431.1 MAG: sirohydrochlorin cobaltochelatase [Thaumarchaeota archaeon 13_1_40CM_3_38_6]OLD41253.1 MAG: sirohydrochlorin cobaltochelatase [Thaumarchaeota archaeon 13_1_40CM_2_39_4]TLY03685.1 MAG: sirohydrochlorin cobaltochelatase [Nitrososphaerota archaeon]